ncbi:uncharacterized protein LOC128448791 [Pleuronectes platessa]|uniref:uncharacterized protein LOC128448791 n=1 Tax=Pleuronectes platessa TaxID=8262 RepID=UPI00232A171E|nr:uncharacterized protein LOC128448791 [Pleuronectes platessa]
MLMRDGDDTARKKRELLTGHDINHNIWYRNANLTAYKSNVTNCYVCSFVPHHANSNPFWTPEPETEVNTLCIVAFWYMQVIKNDKYFTRWLPNCTKSQPIKEWRDPRNYTKKTNQTNLEGIAPARYPTKSPFCFSVTCRESFRTRKNVIIPATKYLGKSDFLVTLKVASDADQNKGYWHPLYSDSSPSKPCNHLSVHCNVDHAPINWTAVGERAEIQGWQSIPSMWMFLPGENGYPSPTTHVWVCGKDMYLYLPNNWCGTCHLARLVPAVVLIPAADVSKAMANTPTRIKRSMEETTVNKDKEPLVNDARGVFMTIFPMYGVAYLAHRMNEMHADLEDIAESLEGVLKHLVEDPEKRAMRAMILQNRLALDYLLANQGGVCELIGDQCCTFIPDPTSNLTNMLNKVTELRKHLTDKKDGQWSPWTWLSSGGYLQIVGKILIPVGAVLLLFCVFMSCVLPCIRTMINKAVGQSVTAVMMSEEYLTLLHSPDGDGDIDLEDEDTEL